jgi:DNA-binding MarR family transcriptional regulator
MGLRIVTMNDDVDFSLIEAFFFAYRDFVKEADHQLSLLGLGRAHHRALYFIYRRPDLTVTQLLDILQITKQSLNRVLGTLLTMGYIVQQQGAQDRRQRHLRTTERGTQLSEELALLQHTRLKNALRGQQGPEPEEALTSHPYRIVLDFLQKVQDPQSDTTCPPVEP